MINIRRILCPTDFSEASKAALRYAFDVATLTQAHLYLVHVVRPIPYAPPDPNYHFEVPEYERYLRADAERRLDDLIQSGIPSGVAVHKILRNGEIAEEILEAARELSIDLIVIATHGETGWRHLVFGSVAEKIVRLAQCPVLSVRQPNAE